MKTLPVNLAERSYEISIGSGLLEQAGETTKAVCPRAKRVFLVTDANVNRFGYARRLEESLKKAAFEVFVRVEEAGEHTKRAAVLSRLWETMAEAGLTRTDAVIALGGGVVGDLAGFAAATILRGVDFIQIPTTLLAQVDSSVGGKTAIDLTCGKNLAGAFWQPKAVLMDTSVLNTLSDETFSDGMAEVIKYGCIWDRDFFDFLSAHPTRAKIMDQIDHVLYTCCDIKRKVVERDERDAGLRMLLNFGHTLGHAYELAGHYETWTHGQAVAAGMCAAAKLGAALEITPPQTVPAVEGLCAAFGLPVAIPCSMEDYAAAIGRDKKSAGDQISLILLKKLGHAEAYPMARTALLERIEELFGGERT